jgi:hypothetical protein
MAGTRKYYLKNNYLTFRSKVKVPRRSLRYTTQLRWEEAEEQNQTKTICLPSFEGET